MKTYVLCTTLDEKSIETLKKVKRDLDLKHVHLHIVTIYEVQIYNVGLLPYVYPTTGQYEEIENAALSILKSLGHSLGVADENLTVKCFFDHNREQKIKDYLTKAEANLAIVATRGKYGIDGFFDSSFTDYLCKFSPCDVLVMRP